MPFTNCGIVVEPGAVAAVVRINIGDSAGAVPAVYDDAGTAITLPATVTSRTVFNLADEGIYSVSVLVSGAEVATKANTRATVVLRPGQFEAIEFNATPRLISSSYVLPWGPGQYRFLMPSQGSTTQTLTASREYAVPFFVVNPVTLIRLGIEVTTLAASSAIRLGLRHDNGYGHPGALLLDAGTVAGTAAAAVELTISQPLQAGVLYWATATGQGGAPAVRSVNNTVPGMDHGSAIASVTGTPAIAAQYQEPVAGALPATFSTTVQGAAGPRIFARSAT